MGWGRKQELMEKEKHIEGQKMKLQNENSSKWEWVIWTAVEFRATERWWKEFIKGVKIKLRKRNR